MENSNSRKLVWKLDTDGRDLKLISTVGNVGRRFFNVDCCEVCFR